MALTKKFYNVVELANVLGISRQMAYQLVKADGFPKINVGSRIIIPIDRFDAWVTEQSA